MKRCRHKSFHQFFGENGRDIVNWCEFCGSIRVDTGRWERPKKADWDPIYIQVKGKWKKPKWPDWY